MGLISASIIDSDIVLMITARRDRYCAYLMVRVTTAHIIDMVISSTRIRWCFMSMLPRFFYVCCMVMLWHFIGGYAVRHHP